MSGNVLFAEDVVARALEEGAAVAVEQRVERDPADRVALEPVAVGLDQLEADAAVAVELLSRSTLFSAPLTSEIAGLAVAR